jgi:hypothetical protein
VIAQFIESQLAAIDSLDELKVTLVVLRLLEQRGGGMASVTEADLLAHPAIRDGLRMPAITLRPALLMAAARGTLVFASAGDAVRYFRADAEGRRAAEAYERGAHGTAASQPAGAQNADAARLLQELGAQLARLESIDFYAPSPDDPTRIEEWAARGYTRDEAMAAVREALLHPRPRGRPHRTLADCERALFQAPPAQPSEYFEICISRERELPDEIRNLKMRINRMPTHAEFTALRESVALFGIRAVLETLRTMDKSGGIDVARLIPLLSESEEAALAAARTTSDDERKLRQVIRLYETTVGLPPNATIVDDMRAVLHDVPELATWQAVLDRCAATNKKMWPYIRTLLLNPSPALFTPPPANDVARRAFDMYRQRINRQIDPVVAGEINALSEQVTDTQRWLFAFDSAAAANALRWDYIRSVLTARPDAAPAAKGAARRAPAERTQAAKRTSTFRRDQAKFSPEERRAAEEEARHALEEDDDE